MATASIQAIRVEGVGAGDRVRWWAVRRVADGHAWAGVMLGIILGEAAFDGGTYVMGGPLSILFSTTIFLAMKLNTLFFLRDGSPYEHIWQSDWIQMGATRDLTFATTLIGAQVVLMLAHFALAYGLRRRRSWARWGEVVSSLTAAAFLGLNAFAYSRGEPIERWGWLVGVLLLVPVPIVLLLVLPGTGALFTTPRDDARPARRHWFTLSAQFLGVLLSLALGVGMLCLWKWGPSAELALAMAWRWRAG